MVSRGLLSPSAHLLKSDGSALTLRPIEEREDTLEKEEESGYSQEEFEWNKKLQADLAQLSRNSKQIIAQRAVIIFSLTIQRW
jgi:hypothetical protein